MRDQRLDKLASVIVEYSTGIKPGQIVRVSGDVIALPLLEAIYERCLLAGAYPFLKCSSEAVNEFFLEHATQEQLKFVSPLAQYEVEKIDVSIGLWAETNTKGLSQIDPARQSVASAARKPIFKVFMDRAAKAEGEPGKLRWCGTLFPTAASAQDAEMSLKQYEDFVFGAGYLDRPDPVAEWKKIHVAQERVREYLQGKREIRFQAANGTDLRVNVDGATWINCSGHENFPDGEVFCGPQLQASDGGVNGVVRYSFPAVHHGREVHDIELTFTKGRVTQARASKNQDFLIQMLDQDAGASRLG